MYPARRAYALVAQGVFAARSAVQSLVAPVRYELLAQDSWSIKRTQLRLQQPRKILVLAGSCLFVIAVFVFYSHGNSAAAVTIPAAALSRATISKAQYIDAVLRDPVEGLVDLRPIRKKCDETKFQEGLVWQCAPVNGGYGNVVNMALNCVRYALEAGATTLILPRISVRADNLIDLGSSGLAEMSYLLDVDHFLASWEQACPQMRATVSDSAARNLSRVELSPASVKAFEMRKYLVVDPTGWREAFDAWMAKNAVFKKMSAEQPVLLWQNLAFAQWNREAHPPDFANSFSRLFRQPPQTRRLAAAVLWSLERNISRPVVAETILFSSAAPSNASIVNSLGTQRLSLDGFLGAHLRVAADAAAAGWPGYEAQAPFYIEEARTQMNLTTIYLATGSVENRDQFREDARLVGLNTVSKEELLDEEELSELRKLTWDQQALVDFEVLLHAAKFCGFVRSSYSWALALRRGTLPEAGIPEWSKDDLEYRDNLSAVVGRYGSINPEGLWP